MDLPLVSINIPAFNAQETIKKTIESLLKQSYTNIEIHVIDNDSTDETREIVKSYQDPKLKLIKNDVNIGAEANFEKCMQLGSGKYTAIYHADDVYDQHIVTKSVALLERNERIGIVTTRAQFIDSNSKKMGESKTFYALKQKNDSALILNFQQLFKLILKYHNFLICPSAMVRSSIYKNAVKTWSGDLFKSSADLDVWLKIASLAELAIINKTLMSYRLSKHHFSHLYNLKRTEEADFFNVIDYWLKKESAQLIVSNADLKNYQLLKFEDASKCCLHAFLLGNDALAEELLTKLEALYSRNYLVHSFKSLVFSLIYFALIAHRKTRALLPLLKKIDSLLTR